MYASALQSTTSVPSDRHCLDQLLAPVLPLRSFPALLIPADEADDVCLVDLHRNDKGTAYEGARSAIGCRVVHKVSVDGPGAIALDFLSDENAQYSTRPLINGRAIDFWRSLLTARTTGEYPAPAGASDLELMQDAYALFHRRFIGSVVVVGANVRAGNWVPVPDRLVEFAQETMLLDVG